MVLYTRYSVCTVLLCNQAHYEDKHYHNTLEWLVRKSSIICKRIIENAIDLFTVLKAYS